VRSAVAFSWIVDGKKQCDVHVVLGAHMLQAITPSRTAGALEISCSDVDQHTSIPICYTQLSIVHACGETRAYWIRSSSSRGLRMVKTWSLGE
jgi:hypothetical protein